MADSLPTLLGLGDGLGAGYRVFLQCPAWLNTTDGLAGVTWRDLFWKTDRERTIHHRQLHKARTIPPDSNQENRKYSGQVCPQALRGCTPVVKLLPVT